MKTEEDEAFDDLAKKQGDWGGGFKAKRAMAADKLQDGKCKLCIDGCAACDARAQPAQKTDILTIAYQSGYYDGKKAALAGREWNFCERCGKRTADLTVIHTCTPPQQEAIYGMNQDDWKDVVAAIAKVRDGRGIYLGCRPADVFKDWFLALGTAKVKEKNSD
jgi:hypothetical protein